MATTCESVAISPKRSDGQWKHTASTTSERASRDPGWLGWFALHIVRQRSSDELPT